MRIKDYIPVSYYSDGTESKCWIYRICDMFDVSFSYKNSFKAVTRIKNMDEKKESKTTATIGKLNRGGFVWSDD